MADLKMSQSQNFNTLERKVTPVERFFTRSPFSIVTMVARIKGDVSEDILNWFYLEPTIFEALKFNKLGGLVPSDSARYEKLSAFSTKEDVVSRILQRDNLDSLETKHWGTAVTNLGRLEFPRTYGALELDRLIMQPGGGIPLANANLVLGAVTCSGKLSLVVEYAQEAVDTDTMEKIKDKALELIRRN